MSPSDQLDIQQPNQWTVEGAQATRSLASTIARKQSGSGTIALTGPLGAGKTTFVAGLVSELGGSAESVRSPTFTLINEYPSTEPFVAHADLYRAESSESQETIGLEEYFDRGVLLVEWAGRWTGRWPEDAAHAHFEYDGPDRRVIEWHPRINPPLPTVDKTVESS